MVRTLNFKVIVDQTDWIFVSLGLLVSLWAALDTRRVLWLLSYGRRKVFPDRAVTVIRVPAIICVVGLIWAILTALISN